MNATETAILPAYRRVAGAQVEAVIPAGNASCLALSTATIEVLAKPLQTPWSRAASIRAFDPEESKQ